MIFKYFRQNNRGKNLRFLLKTKAKLFNNLTVTLVFEKNANFFLRKLDKIAENCDDKNANFFRRKLAKIAENSDYNIDPLVTWAISLEAFSRLDSVRRSTGCRFKAKVVGHSLAHDSLERFLRSVRRFQLKHF
jgi:hypothetical protein